MKKVTFYRLVKHEQFVDDKSDSDAIKEAIKINNIIEPDYEGYGPLILVEDTEKEEVMRCYRFRDYTDIGNNGVYMGIYDAAISEIVRDDTLPYGRALLSDREDTGIPFILF